MSAFQLYEIRVELSRNYHRCVVLVLSVLLPVFPFSGGAICSGIPERNDSVSRPRDGSPELQLQFCYVGMTITKSVRDSQLPCCHRRVALQVLLEKSALKIFTIVFRTLRELRRWWTGNVI